MMTGYGAYILPAILAASAAAIYVWPLGVQSKAPDKAARYAGPEFQVRGVGAAAAEPALHIAVRTVEQAASASTVPPVLVGIAGNSAWLRLPASGETVRGTVGESVDGWTVTEIRPRGVVIRSADRTETLALFGQPWN